MGKVFIHTFGCSSNIADSELMAGLLTKAGYNLVDSAEKADIVIINSCVVKGKTETNVLKEIKKLGKLKKKIIVTGCMPETKLYSEELKGVSIIGLSETEKIVEAVNLIRVGKIVCWMGDKKKEKACFPRLRKNPVIAVVVISSGCLGQCTYCMTKIAKGELFSYSDKAIVEEIKIAVKEGCKEIWLTSQDCAAYGFDIGTTITNLLEKICAIEGEFLVRLGMSNPDNIYKNLDKLVEIYKHPKIFKFLHIPVQSGNNEILKLMNRKYRVEDFKKIINTFKKEIPNITISTDLICGFPSETEKQFQDSYDLLAWLKPDIINLNMFWPRPGTSAAKMKQLAPGISRKRTRKVNATFRKYALEENKKLIGEKTEILIDENGRKIGYMGRNQFYKLFVIKGQFNLGDLIKVKITDATRNYLICEKV